MCEAAPIHVLPTVKDACAEGAFRFPIFSEGQQRPELSLNTLHMTFATPSFMPPWGQHILTTNMTAGRQRIRWGPGLTGGLVLSGYASLDGLAFQADLGEVRYTQVQAARDFESGKWLLAHRLEGYALPNLKLGISEAVAVSGGFRMQLAHLIPACPYYLMQHLTIKKDREQDRWTNVLISVDASVGLEDGILAYAEFMADDFPWALSAKGRVPYMIGGLVGISLRKPLQSHTLQQESETKRSEYEDDEPESYYSVTAEYVRIHNYVYSHKNPDNTYVTKSGTLIGHPLGPDADGIYLVLALDSHQPIWRAKSGRITLCLGYERHGEGVLGQPWQPADGISRQFLSELVETRKVLALSACTDFLKADITPSRHIDIHSGHRLYPIQPQAMAGERGAAGGSDISERGCNTSLARAWRSSWKRGGCTSNYNTSLGCSGQGDQESTERAQAHSETQMGALHDTQRDRRCNQLLIEHCGKARGYYPEKRKGSSSCDGRGNIDGVLGGN